MHAVAGRHEHREATSCGLLLRMSQCEGTFQTNFSVGTLQKFAGLGDIPTFQQCCCCPVFDACMHETGELVGSLLQWKAPPSHDAAGLCEDPQQKPAHFWAQDWALPAGGLQHIIHKNRQLVPVQKQASCAAG